VTDNTIIAGGRTKRDGSDDEMTLVERPVSRATRRSRIPVTMNAAIAAGGAFGALARVELDRLMPPAHGGWPWITLLINVSGSVLLGYLATRLVERLPPSTYRRPFAGTGFCGALTTFSTFQVELVRLARSGHVLIAASYASASVVSGLLAVLVTTHVVRRARWSLG
jgi:fluoride exporter